MSIIEIHENKTLKLIQVISQELNYIKLQNLDNEIDKFVKN